MSKQKLPIIIAITIFLISPYKFYGSIPDDPPEVRSGFYFGFKLGVFFANKNTADFYNGKGANNIQRIFSIPQYYNAIKQLLIYDFSLWSYPEDMKYEPAIQFGIYGKFHFNDKIAFYTDFSYANLITENKFTLLIDDPMNTSPEPVLEYGDISGKEERIILNAGFRKIFGNHIQWNPYIEGGVNITNLKVQKSIIQIKDLIYNLKFHSYPPQDLYEGGIGIGYLTGGGIQYDIDTHFSFDLGLSLSFDKIDLGENNKYLFQKGILMRIIYK